MHAVNAVMVLVGRTPISRGSLDILNDNIALEEALLLDTGFASSNALDPKGNYPVDVVTSALHIRGLPMPTRERERERENSHIPLAQERA
jgi:hypothetical protein